MNDEITLKCNSYIILEGRIIFTDQNTLFVLVSKILFIHLYILEWRFPYLQAILMIKSYFHIGLINPSSPVLKNQKTYKADILNKHLEEKMSFVS